MQNRNMVISLIGRPNVGKSSLFNAIMKRQNKALTHDIPGVTRDRHYGISKFDELPNSEECEAIIVDTGGFYPSKIEEDETNASHFFNIMTDHAHTAIKESDLVLFVVDVREGILPFDKDISDYIRSQKKPFWVLVNKYDTEKQAGLEAEFYALGIEPEQMFVTSASHGLGLQVLRERIHQECIDFGYKKNSAPTLQKGVTPAEEVVARLALIGAPNAGKSTLLNQFIGAQRALVSSIAGTTVDPIEGFFDVYFGDDAKKLEEEVKFKRQDSLLFQKYEEFRKNNPDVYENMVVSFHEEEATFPEEFEYLAEDSEEEYQDEELDKETIGDETAEIDDLYTKVFDTEVIGAEEEEEEEEDKDKENNEEETETVAGSHWRSLHVVDTAGIRRQKSIAGFIEEQSVYRSLRCITESDIVLYLIDGTKGIGHQDRRLLDIALEKGKSIIILLNKIDLLKEELSTDKARKEWLEKLKYDLPWLSYCEILPISAKNNRGLKRVKEAIKKTVFVRRVAVPTGALNRHVFDLTERNPIMLKHSGGKQFKVKYASQVKSNPPTFLLFTNKSKGIPEHYKRYLRNGLRNRFPMDNTPIHMIFRSAADLSSRMKKIGKSTLS